MIMLRIFKITLALLSLQVEEKIQYLILVAKV